jgi:hypothetical protein
MTFKIPGNPSTRILEKLGILLAGQILPINHDFVATVLGEALPQNRAS